MYVIHVKQPKGLHETQNDKSAGYAEPKASSRGNITPRGKTLALKTIKHKSATPMIVIARMPPRVHLL